MRAVVHHILLATYLIGVIAAFTSVVGGMFFGMEVFFQGEGSVFGNTIVSLLGFLGWTTMQTLFGLLVMMVSTILDEIISK